MNNQFNNNQYANNNHQFDDHDLYRDVPNYAQNEGLMVNQELPTNNIYSINSTPSVSYMVPMMPMQYVVQQQPQSQVVPPFPKETDKANEWRYGLCDCFSDCQVCCSSLLCPLLQQMKMESHLVCLRFLKKIYTF